MGAAAVEAALRAGGCLERGGVARVRVLHRRGTLFSRIAHLHMDYLPGTPAGAPRHLLLKAARAKHHARREGIFYRYMAPRIRPPGLARCYGIGMGGSGSFLLLEDFSDTHRVHPRTLPTPAHYQRLVELLARLHAWGRDGRREQFPAPPDLDAARRREHGEFEARNRRFVAALGDTVGSELRDAYARILASPTRDWLLLRSEGRTLCHGDTHGGNVLYPRDHGPAPVLIDWQLWNWGAGVRDVAYLVALHWPAAQRAGMERSLLEHYHARLRANGVSDYSWDECWRDYRLAVIRNLFTPDLLWAVGIPQAKWLPLLHRAGDAYRDLRCAELL